MREDGEVSEGLERRVACAGGLSARIISRCGVKLLQRESISAVRERPRLRPGLWHEVFDAEWIVDREVFVFIRLIRLVESPQDVHEFRVVQGAVRVLGSTGAAEFLVGRPCAAFPGEAEQVALEGLWGGAVATQHSYGIEEQAVVIFWGEIAHRTPQHV